MKLCRKKNLKESVSEDRISNAIVDYFEGHISDAFYDLMNETISRVDDFRDEDDIASCIDDALIYDDDIWTILKFYSESPKEVDYDACIQKFGFDVTSICSQLADNGYGDETDENESLKEDVNPLDGIEKQPIFETDDGEVLGVEYEGGKLYAGSITNSGIMHEYEMPYESDLSLDANLQKFSEMIEEQRVVPAEWTEVGSKRVLDADGFYTDYTWYKNKNGDKHIFMFGDKDSTDPDDGYADWECDSGEEAQEWFDSYSGFEDWDDEPSDHVFYDNEAFVRNMKNETLTRQYKRLKNCKRECYTAVKEALKCELGKRHNESLQEGIFDKKDKNLPVWTVKVAHNSRVYFDAVDKWEKSLNHLNKYYTPLEYQNRHEYIKEFNVRAKDEEGARKFVSDIIENSTTNVKDAYAAKEGRKVAPVPATGFFRIISVNPYKGDPKFVRRAFENGEQFDKDVTLEIGIWLDAQCTHNYWYKVAQADNGDHMANDPMDV